MAVESNADIVFKIDAMISYILHIPFPEQLSDTVWAEKWAQVKYLIDQGIIAPKHPI
ncbi:hypothetical protein [Flavobacterium oreochromis]|uniref:hypothetical protein n=1 Tax=Flavobacterium oreochromis TaxID=2906078 RepID=UPI0013FE21C2|nr:hypothetical protein [Flavobacterium oreochromis]